MKREGAGNKVESERMRRKSKKAQGQTKTDMGGHGEARLDRGRARRSDAAGAVARRVVVAEAGACQRQLQQIAAAVRTDDATTGLAADAERVGNGEAVLAVRVAVEARAARVEVRPRVNALALMRDQAVLAAQMSDDRRRGASARTRSDRQGGPAPCDAHGACPADLRSPCTWLCPSW